MTRIRYGLLTSAFLSAACDTAALPENALISDRKVRREYRGGKAIVGANANPLEDNAFWERELRYSFTYPNPKPEPCSSKSYGKGKVGSKGSKGYKGLTNSKGSKSSKGLGSNSIGCRSSDDTKLELEPEPQSYPKPKSEASPSHSISNDKGTSAKGVDSKAITSPSHESNTEVSTSKDTSKNSKDSHSYKTASTSHEEERYSDSISGDAESESNKGNISSASESSSDKEDDSFYAGCHDENDSEHRVDYSDTVIIDYTYELVTKNNNVDKVLYELEEVLFYGVAYLMLNLRHCESETRRTLEAHGYRDNSLPPDHREMEEKERVVCLNSSPKDEVQGKWF